MRKGHELEEWMPLFLKKWTTSDAIRSMKDFHRGWYIELLVRAWGSSNPCHLRYDLKRLWKTAGAESEKYFTERCRIVLDEFQVVVIDGEEWLVQPDQLEIYTNQLSAYRNRVERARKGGLSKAASSMLTVEHKHASSIQTTVSNLSSGSFDSSLKREELEFNATICAKMVNDSAGIDYVGREAQWLYRDIIDKEHELTGVSRENIAEVMVAARNDYLAIPGKEFNWPCKAFFAQGIWKKREEWVHGKSKLSRKTQQGRDALASFKQSEARRTSGVDNGDSGSDRR